MKLLTQRTYKCPILPGGVEAEEVLLSETFYHPEFDKVVAERQYGQNGELEQLTEYAYDDQGFMVREVLKERDGSVMEEKTYEPHPDDPGRVGRELLHYADGSVDTLHYEYDGQGRLIRKVLVDSDGDPERIEVYAYENELLVAEAVLDGEETLQEEKEYTYDTSGRLTEVLHHNVFEDILIKRVNAYDENGHRESLVVYDRQEEPVERVLFENDEKGRPVKVIEENRSKKNTLHLRYDDNGMVAFQEEFDLHGRLVSRVERKHDEKGRLLQSKVKMEAPARGLSSEYLVRNEYEFAGH